MLNKSIPTKFDEGDFERLNYFSKLYDRPVSYLIREATRSYLDNQAKKLEFLQEGTVASEHYHSTGLHCDHQEMKKWLKALSEERVSEKPQCHE
jgi:predicted transcriptional regulator